VEDRKERAAGCRRVQNVLNVDRDLDIDQETEYQLLENVSMFHAEDLKEDIRAFQEKRVPKFQGK